MNALSEAVFAALLELPRAESRCRYHLRRRDCRLVRGHRGYLAVSRTTGSVEMGPLDIDAMEKWARARASA